MNVTTWNVNSLRVRLDRVLAWLDAHRPDVLCLQEIKCVDADVPHLPFVARGYTVASHGQKTYNGVAIVSRLPMTEVVRGLPDPSDPQARGIAATIAGVRVLNLYVPNGGDLTSDKYPYKLAWLDTLAETAAPLASAPTVICGDFNIAPTDADCHDPAGWAGQVLVSAPERARLQRLLDLGYVDALRRVDGRPGRYTWWDYRGDMFAQDKGLRIDHHLVSTPLATRILDVSIDLDARASGATQPSDHAPVTLFLRDEAPDGA
ncbi:MAG: exodeoxyribonuclease [Pseudomonadota bacterium]|jgi:exodeoxyribonuclease-3